MVQMNITELRKLTVNMMERDAKYLVACSPERLIAMLDVIEAADEMRDALESMLRPSTPADLGTRKWGATVLGAYEDGKDSRDAYDVARAKLEEL
jgi:hypothetical protein